MGKDRTVHIVGRGKVGTAIRSALQARGIDVTTTSYREGVSSSLEAELVVYAVRDGALELAIRRAAERTAFKNDAVVLHVAGCYGLEVLEPLKGKVRGMGCMHPMIAFAGAKTPRLADGHALVDGDEEGLRGAQQLAEWLGLRARRMQGLDRGGYHAAAAFVAAGAVALAHEASKLLQGAGVEGVLAPKVLGPLLRSVGENIDSYGTVGALTGPIRRGDVEIVRRHAQAIRKHAPSILPTWRELSMLQVAMAEELGEASKEDLEAIVELVQQQR